MGPGLAACIFGPQHPRVSCLIVCPGGETQALACKNSQASPHETAFKPGEAGAPRDLIPPLAASPLLEASGLRPPMASPYFFDLNFLT